MKRYYFCLLFFLTVAFSSPAFAGTGGAECPWGVGGCCVTNADCRCSTICGGGGPHCLATTDCTDAQPPRGESTFCSGSTLCQVGCHDAHGTVWDHVYDNSNLISFPVCADNRFSGSYPGSVVQTCSATCGGCTPTPTPTPLPFFCLSNTDCPCDMTCQGIFCGAITGCESGDFTWCSGSTLCRTGARIYNHGCLTDAVCDNGNSSFPTCSGTTSMSGWVEETCSVTCGGCITPTSTLAPTSIPTLAPTSISTPAPTSISTPAPTRYIQWYYGSCSVNACAAL